MFLLVYFSVFKRPLRKYLKDKKNGYVPISDFGLCDIFQTHWLVHLPPNHDPLQASVPKPPNKDDLRSSERTGVLNIYTNHPVRNLVRKHKTIKFDVVGERPASKQWRIQGRGPGDPLPPALFLDQSVARKIFLETRSAPSFPRRRVRNP